MELSCLSKRHRPPDSQTERSNSRPQTPALSISSVETQGNKCCLKSSKSKKNKQEKRLVDIQEEHKRSFLAHCKKALSISASDKSIMKSQLKVWFPFMFTGPGCSSLHETALKLKSSVAKSFDPTQIVKMNEQLSSSKSGRVSHRRNVMSRGHFPSPVGLPGGVTETNSLTVKDSSQTVEEERPSELCTVDALSNEIGRASERKDEPQCHDFAQEDTDHISGKSGDKEAGGMVLATNKQEDVYSVDTFTKETGVSEIPQWFLSLVQASPVLDLELWDDGQGNGQEHDTPYHRIELKLVSTPVPGEKAGTVHVVVKEIMSESQGPEAHNKQEEQKSSGLQTKTHGSDTGFQNTSYVYNDNPRSRRATKDTPMKAVSECSLISKVGEKETVSSVFNEIFPEERTLSFQHVWKQPNTKLKRPKRGLASKHDYRKPTIEKTLTTARTSESLDSGDSSVLDVSSIYTLHKAEPTSKTGSSITQDKSVILRQKGANKSTKGETGKTRQPNTRNRSRKPKLERELSLEYLNISNSSSNGTNSSSIFSQDKFAGAPKAGLKADRGGKCDKPRSKSPKKKRGGSASCSPESRRSIFANYQTKYGEAAASSSSEDDSSRYANSSLRERPKFKTLVNAKPVKRRAPPTCVKHEGEEIPCPPASTKTNEKLPVKDKPIVPTNGMQPSKDLQNGDIAKVVTRDSATKPLPGDGVTKPGKENLEEVQKKAQEPILACSPTANGMAKPAPLKDRESHNQPRRNNSLFERQSSPARARIQDSGRGESEKTPTFGKDTVKNSVLSISAVDDEICGDCTSAKVENKSPQGLSPWGHAAKIPESILKEPFTQARRGVTPERVTVMPVQFAKDDGGDGPNKAVSASRDQIKLEPVRTFSGDMTSNAGGDDEEEEEAEPAKAATNGSGANVAEGEGEGEVPEAEKKASGGEVNPDAAGATEEAAKDGHDAAKSACNADTIAACMRKWSKPPCCITSPFKPNLNPPCCQNPCSASSKYGAEEPPKVESKAMKCNFTGFTESNKSELESLIDKHVSYLRAAQGENAAIPQQTSFISGATDPYSKICKDIAFKTTADLFNSTINKDKAICPLEGEGPSDAFCKDWCPKLPPLCKTGPYYIPKPCPPACSPCCPPVCPPRCPPSCPPCFPPSCPQPCPPSCPPPCPPRCPPRRPPSCPPICPPSCYDPKMPKLNFPPICRDPCTGFAKPCTPPSCVPKLPRICSTTSCSDSCPPFPRPYCPDPCPKPYCPDPCSKPFCFDPCPKPYCPDPCPKPYCPDPCPKPYCPDPYPKPYCPDPCPKPYCPDPCPKPYCPDPCPKPCYPDPCKPCSPPRMCIDPCTKRLTMCSPPPCRDPCAPLPPPCSPRACRIDPCSGLAKPCTPRSYCLDPCSKLPKPCFERPSCIDPCSGKPCSPRSYCIDPCTTLPKPCLPSPCSVDPLTGCPKPCPPSSCYIDPCSGIPKPCTPPPAPCGDKSCYIDPCTGLPRSCLSPRQYRIDPITQLPILCSPKFCPNPCLNPCEKTSSISCNSGTETKLAASFYKDPCAPCRPRPCPPLCMPRPCVRSSSFCQKMLSCDPCTGGTISGLSNRRSSSLDRQCGSRPRSSNSEQLFKKMQCVESKWSGIRAKACEVMDHIARLQQEACCPKPCPSPCAKPCPSPCPKPCPSPCYKPCPSPCDPCKPWCVPEPACPPCKPVCPVPEPSVCTQKTMCCPVTGKCMTTTVCEPQTSPGCKSACNQTSEMSRRATSKCNTPCAQLNESSNKKCQVGCANTCAEISTCVGPSLMAPAPPSPSRKRGRCEKKCTIMRIGKCQDGSQAQEATTTEPSCCSTQAEGGKIAEIAKFVKECLDDSTAASANRPIVKIRYNSAQRCGSNNCSPQQQEDRIKEQIAKAIKKGKELQKKNAVTQGSNPSGTRARTVLRFKAGKNSPDQCEIYNIQMEDDNQSTCFKKKSSSRKNKHQSPGRLENCQEMVTPCCVEQSQPAQVCTQEDNYPCALTAEEQPCVQQVANQCNSEPVSQRGGDLAVSQPLSFHKEQAQACDAPLLDADGQHQQPIELCDQRPEPCYQATTEGNYQELTEPCYQVPIDYLSGANECPEVHAVSMENASACGYGCNDSCYQGQQPPEYQNEADLGAVTQTNVQSTEITVPGRDPQNGQQSESNTNENANPGYYSSNVINCIGAANIDVLSFSAPATASGVRFVREERDTAKLQQKRSTNHNKELPSRHGNENISDYWSPGNREQRKQRMYLEDPSWEAYEYVRANMSSLPSSYTSRCANPDSQQSGTPLGNTMERNPTKAQSVRKGIAKSPYTICNRKTEDHLSYSKNGDFYTGNSKHSKVNLDVNQHRHGANDDGEQSNSPNMASGGNHVLADRAKIEHKVRKGKTGKVKWQIDNPSKSNVTSPVVSGSDNQDHLEDATATAATIGHEGSDDSTEGIDDLPLDTESLVSVKNLANDKCIGSQNGHNGTVDFSDQSVPNFSSVMSQNVILTSRFVRDRSSVLSGSREMYAGNHVELCSAMSFQNKIVKPTNRERILDSYEGRLMYARDYVEVCSSMSFQNKFISPKVGVMEEDKHLQGNSGPEIGTGFVNKSRVRELPTPRKPKRKCKIRTFKIMRLDDEEVDATKRNDNAQPRDFVLECPCPGIQDKGQGDESLSLQRRGKAHLAPTLLSKTPSLGFCPVNSVKSENTEQSTYTTRYSTKADAGVQPCLENARQALDVQTMTDLSASKEHLCCVPVSTQTGSQDCGLTRIEHGSGKQKACAEGSRSQRDAETNLHRNDSFIRVSSLNEGRKTGSTNSPEGALVVGTQTERQGTKNFAHTSQSFDLQQRGTGQAVDQQGAWRTLHVGCAELTQASPQRVVLEGAFVKRVQSHGGKQLVPFRLVFFKRSGNNGVGVAVEGTYSRPNMESRAEQVETWGFRV